MSSNDIEQIKREFAFIDDPRYYAITFHFFSSPPFQFRRHELISWEMEYKRNSNDVVIKINCRTNRQEFSIGQICGFSLFISVENDNPAFHVNRNFTTCVIQAHQDAETIKIDLDIANRQELEIKLDEVKSCKDLHFFSNITVLELKNGNVHYIVNDNVDHVEVIYNDGATPSHAITWQDPDGVKYKLHQKPTPVQDLEDLDLDDNDNAE